MRARQLLDATALWLALGVTLATGAGLLARWAWVFELATHFRLQYLIIGVLAFGMLAIRRRWGWLAVLAPCLLVNGLPMLPYLPAAADAGPVGEPIVLVTVNVRSSNRRYRSLLESLEREKPDLILLVEYNERWGRNLAPLDESYPYSVRIAERGPYGIALLSRRPLSETRKFRLRSTSAIDTVVTVGARRFRLIGVHLRSPTSSARAAERNEQLLDLTAMARAATMPMLFLGDFNSTTFSPYLGAWLASTGLRDAARGQGWRATWPTSLPMFAIPIDHCIVSEEFAVLHQERLPRFGSDHYPLLTVLALRERV
jgi:endonuclease/exonuclease/phosphatase (EEP) superfamily protein YafD